MSSGDIRQTLRKTLSDELSIDAESIHDDAHLVADLGFDSVAFSVGSVVIEEAIGVQVPIADLMKCTTFGDLAAVVEARTR